MSAYQRTWALPTALHYKLGVFPRFSSDFEANGRPEDFILYSLNFSAAPAFRVPMIQMTDELSNLLRAHGEAQGKADLYAAVGDFLKKYGEKLNRQYNESHKAYKKLEKAGHINDAQRALSKTVLIQYQELAQRDLSIEILQRQESALRQSMSAKEALIAYFEQHGEGEEESSD